MSLEAVLEIVPELHHARSVEDLSGGLTNTNYKVVTDAGAYVVRIAGKDTDLLGIDRANETHNTIAAAETGVGAHVVASLPEQTALVLEFIEGRRLHADDLRAGTLVRLSLDQPTEELGGIYAVYLPDRNPAAKVRAFIDFCAEHFAPEPPWDRRI